MKKSKYAVPAMLAMMVLGSQAHALEATVRLIVSPVVTVAALVDLTIFGPTATSVNLTTPQKAAIVNAQMDAVEVLKGAEATEAFLAAKAALEEATGQQLGQAQAASGIIEAGVQLEK
ncbi:MAG: hypothetical protein NDJ89_12355 [Oligoflexia bacterium]|nr:hypothetical protein [Oligoflexia bacterium]